MYSWKQACLFFCEDVSMRRCVHFISCWAGFASCCCRLRTSVCHRLQIRLAVDYRCLVLGARLEFISRSLLYFQLSAVRECLHYKGVSCRVLLLP